MPINTSFSATDMPKWLQEYYARMAKKAEQLEGKPYKEYPHNRLAKLPKDILRAHELGRITGAHLPYLSESLERTRKSDTPFTERYQDYMNPYMRDVVNRISEEGMRTFKEKALPALENQFVRAGAYGSSHHRDLAARALRDTQGEILDRQQKALAQGYQQAAQIYNADKARQLESAKDIGALGGMQQAGQAADIAMLENQARYQQQQDQALKDLQYNDWLAQENYGANQLAQQNALMQGQPIPQTQTTYTQTAGTPQMNTAGNIGNLATGLYGILTATRKKKGGHVKAKRK